MTRSAEELLAEAERAARQLQELIVKARERLDAPPEPEREDE